MPGALGGLVRYAKTHRITLPEARRRLERELAFTLHRPIRRRFATLPVLVFEKDEQWVADLVEMQTTAKWNEGTRYLLTVVDVLSKFAWVRPLKKKTGEEVVKAFRDILETSGRKPRRLQTDKGKAFYNTKVQTWLKEKGIEHFSTHGDAKASVVERFNRTLKGRMYRYFTAANTLTYLDVLPALVKAYNADVHHSIGMAPRDVTEINEAQVWQTLYGKRVGKPSKAKFKVGNQVRLSKRVRTFKKGYLPRWTEEVFVVSRVVPGPVTTYRVEEMDGTPLRGTFYEQDLQKVIVDEKTLWRVDKVLKRRPGRMLVSWKGWPAKYNSWIDDASRKRRRRRRV